jgi:hypothetical protein
MMAVSFSGCAGLPHIARKDALTAADTCTASVLTAQAAQSSADGGPTFAVRAGGALAASSAWLKVSTACSTRFSEGIIRAAAAHSIAVSSANRAHVGSAFTSAMSHASLGSASLSGPEVSSIDKTVVRTMAVSQDKAAYALEILAARIRPTDADDETLSLAHRARAASLAELAMTCSSADNKNDSCTTTDPRKKMYSVETLLKDTGTVTDRSSGLTMTTRASLEMTCALEEIEAAADVSSAQNRAALAHFIVVDAAHAYEYGYPSTPLPLVEQAAE